MFLKAKPYFKVNKCFIGQVKGFPLPTPSDVEGETIIQYEAKLSTLLNEKEIIQYRLYLGSLY